MTIRVIKEKTLHLTDDDEVWCIALSADGRRAVFSADGKTLQVWDIESNRPLALLGGHTGNIWNVSLNGDGRYAVSGSDDNTARVWDVESGQCAAVLTGHTGAVYAVALSDDGRRALSGAGDDTVRVWEVEGGLCSAVLKGHTDDLSGVAWSGDGRRILSASSDQTLRLWDAESGRCLVTFRGHTDQVYTAVFSRDGRRALSGSDDKTLRVWDVESGRCLAVMKGHANDVWSLAWGVDGRRALSGSDDRTVRLWDVESGRCLAVLEGPAAGVWGVAWGANDGRVIAATSDGEIWLWSIPEGAGGSFGPSTHYTTAKIALVGDSGVGKTGLGWRLAHGEFTEQSSTHGQQFWTVDKLGERREDGTECEAVLWDLAGQPDYRLVHSLFLDDVDLALVLFDPTNRREPLRGVEYWLGQLARVRPDGRRRLVILVGARADRGGPTLTREELKDFCGRHGVECYVGTSALTGEGLEELLTRMKSSLVWGEMPMTVTTETFRRVKEFVLALKHGALPESVLMSPEGLCAWLRAAGGGWEFTDAEMMTAVRHLANHGYVAVLRRSAGGETILLAPDLLVNLATSFVLEARRNEKGLGALEESRLLSGGYEFSELKGLAKDERDVLSDTAVALFIEHNLCFRKTLGAQTLLIFPALINQKRPSPGEAETVDDCSYRVTGAVENVYASLVVQLGYTNTFSRTNQWKNQAEYETAGGDVCGFRQTEERENEVELVLYQAKGKVGARLLFQGLVEQFLRGRDVTVTKFPPVTCPRCDHRPPRADTVERISEGKGFLFCGECGRKVSLPKAGEDVTPDAGERVRAGERQAKRTTNPSRQIKVTVNEERVLASRRTAFESATVRVKALARDEKKKRPSCFISYAWGDETQERWVRGLAKDLENAGVKVIFDRKDNSQIGANVARFVSRIEQSDFIVVVGTPSYRRKCENEVSSAGSFVAAEVDMINQRLTRTEKEKTTVLPLLLEGDEGASFPPLVRGKVYGRFDKDEMYFPSLFDLILTLYGISFGHPAVDDLRDKLRVTGPCIK
jgi:small GTP-binding protein